MSWEDLEAARLMFTEHMQDELAPGLDLQDHYDRLEAERRLGSRRNMPPFHFFIPGKGELALCAARDLTPRYLNSIKNRYHPKQGLVVHALERVDEATRRVCRECDVHGYWFHISYAPTRSKYLEELIKLIWQTLEDEGFVILHCNGGRHRAATLLVVVLMFFFSA